MADKPKMKKDAKEGMDAVVNSIYENYEDVKRNVKAAASKVSDKVSEVASTAFADPKDYYNKVGSGIKKRSNQQKAADFTKGFKK